MFSEKSRLKLLKSGAKTDLGSYQQYNLSDLFNPDSSVRKGHIIKLAFCTNHALHINEDSFTFFEQFYNYPVAFAGVYGSAGSGKSFFLDKLLNLAEFEGNHYSEQNERAIYVWSEPLVRNKTQIFLMDMPGFKSTDKLTLMEEKLLDLYMLLSSIIILIPEPEDHKGNVLTTVYNYFKKSSLRLLEDDHPASKLHSYWPNTFYCLYRAVDPVKKSQEKVAQLFQEFNFSILHDAINNQFLASTNVDELLVKTSQQPNFLNENYLKHVSAVARDIHENIKPKKYMNVAYNGNHIFKLMVNIIHKLNMKDKLNVDHIFIKTLKESYVSAYNNQIKSYNHNLQAMLSDQQPHSLQELIAIFGVASRKAYQGLNEKVENNELKETYLDKLENYVNQKQAILLEINKKKTEKKLKPELQKVRTFEDVEKMIKTVDPDLNHNRAEIIAPTLLQFKKSGEVGPQNSFHEEEIKIKKYQQKVNQLQKIKASNLKELEVNPDIQHYKEQEQILNSKLQEVKNSRIPVSETHYDPDQAARMERKKAQLLKVIEAQEEDIDELKQPFLEDQNRHISVLKSRLQEKVKEHKQKQAILSSQVPVSKIASRQPQSRVVNRDQKFVMSKNK